MLTQSAQYAIRAMIALANHGDAGAVDAAQIASRLHLPANFLSKILQTLARGGLLHATRGLHGGYYLARPLDEISLLSIVEPFENLKRHQACLMGRPECSQDGCCALHARWRPVREAYLAFLEGSTLSDLAGETPPASETAS